MFPYSGMQSWLSNKLYDYLVFKRPILLIPTDNDIIEQIVTQTKIGIIVKENEDIFKTIKTLQEKKQKLLPLHEKCDKQKIKTFSREESVKSLKKIL